MEEEEDIALHCQHLQVSRMFSSTTKKVWLAVAERHRKLFMHALTQAGGKMKIGTAPVGALEDQMERWLQNMDVE